MLSKEITNFLSWLHMLHFNLHPMQSVLCDAQDLGKQQHFTLRSNIFYVEASRVVYNDNYQILNKFSTSLLLANLILDTHL